MLLIDHLGIYLERYMDKLFGRKDIEKALVELGTLIQGVHYTATAQLLEDTNELKRGP